MRDKNLCATFAFTGNGSRRVHDVEMAAVKTMKEDPPALVDTFTMTDGQCWATGASDGRHYIKLIPLELQMLSDRIRACIARATSS